MGKLKNIIHLILFFPLSANTIIIFSCTPNSQQQTTSMKQDTIKPFIKDDVQPPIVTFLDTCPPPQTINVPKKRGGSYIKQTENGPKEIKLLPPATKTADFYIPMQHYGVEEGLALNSVLCSYCDKDGNLWFGTWGGGVSRYDGKSFVNYSLSKISQGLIDDAVFSIFQDENRHLWIGAWSGVIEYDGKTCKNYRGIEGWDIESLACCVFPCISQDKNDNMWFCSEGGGVSKYDGKSFKTYLPADGLAGDTVHCMLQDKKGESWFGTENGVSRYNGKSFINITTKQGLVGNNVSCMLEDSNGSIWFGTTAGVSRYDGKSFKNFTTSRGLVNNAVTSILEDKSNHIWFGTRKGVSKYDGISFKNFTTANGLAGDEVTSLVKDKNENIWITTLENGVCRYSGEAFISYTEAQGLPANQIASIFQEKNGLLWFGTYGGGAVRYDGKTFTYFTIEQGLADNIVYCIYQDENEGLWVATKHGISYYDGKSFTTYTTDQGLGDNIVWSITEDKKGNLWFGTFGGGVSVLSWDKKSFTTYSIAQGLIDNVIHEVLTDKKGNIWLCNDDGGVTSYDGKLFKHYTEKQGLIHGHAVSIFEDKNDNLWFGTTAGLSRYDGESFMNITPEQGLPDDLVWDIKEDKKGILWFGTRLGFTGLRFKEKNRQSLMQVKNESINSDIAFSNTTLKKDFDPVFETYNFKNGYPVSDIFLNNSLYIDTGNILWAGTGDKLVQFDYTELYKKANFPNVFIQGIKINDENIVWNDLENHKEKGDTNTTSSNKIEEIILFGRTLNEEQRGNMLKKFSSLKFDSITPFYYIPVNLTLPYKHNNITFDFTAIEPDRPDFVRYQYILEGYDDEWNSITNKTTASFGNIHEGNYTFKLKAQSPDGIWSEPIIYRFTVLPPWYRIWWAYLVYASAFVAIVWFYAWYRSRLLKKENLLLENKITERTNELKQSLEEKYEIKKNAENQQAVMNERLRISKELHDEVGATLSGIAMYSQLTKEQINHADTSEVEKSLNIMQQNAGEMVNKLNDIVWLINPDKDTLQKLIQRLDEYATDMAMIKNMQVKVNVPEHLSEHSLPMESRRNIYLFCKEAINNAVKYSNGTLLQLTIKEANNTLEFSVSDNGKGFDAVMVRRGNGLDNMQKRADEIGAKLALQSKKEEGCLVSMQFKIT
jgi:ligand-binding sensor domain-containing protein/signal transduction histidine kinase